MLKKKLIAFACALLLTLTLFTGCSTSGGGGIGVGNADKLDTYNGEFYSGDYSSALKYAESSMGRDSSGHPKNQRLLWMLSAGSAAMANQEYDKAIEYFDYASDTYDHFWSKKYNAAANVGKNTAGTIFNDNVTPYRGQEYDNIMLKTYQGMAFMFSCQWGEARTAFEQTAVAAEEAKERHAARVEAQRQEMEGDQRRMQGYGMSADQIINQPEVKSRIEAAYPQMAEWELYPDYMNPFALYMAGIYSLSRAANSGTDLEAAELSLQRCLSALGGSHPVVEKDLAVVAAMSGRIHDPELLNEGPIVWVIYEAGQGPELEEFRVDLPIPMHGIIQHVGIALPQYRTRPGAYEYLELGDESQTLGRTFRVASMDSIVAREFKRDMPLIVTRRVISTALKTYAQYAAQPNGERTILGTALNLFSLLTNSADVRIWTALPKEFQVARLPRPANGQLTVKTPQGGNLAQVSIPDSKYSIVYLKIPRTGVTVKPIAIGL